MSNHRASSKRKFDISSITKYFQLTQISLLKREPHLGQSSKGYCTNRQWDSQEIIIVLIKFLLQQFLNTLGWVPNAECEAVFLSTWNWKLSPKLSSPR